MFVVVFVLAKVGYSASLIFYDSMLTDVTDHSKMDNLSSQGYAWGYIGSCIPFIVSVVVINFTPLEITVSMPIALCLNAVWWFAMTMPLMRRYRQVHYIERQPHAIRTAFKRLFGVIAEKHRGKKAILLYLVAFFLYIDGVYTIIDMATSFGTALGFDTTQLLLALLVTQFVAFPSAILFGVLASKVRNDRLIFVCIIAYTAIAVFAIPDGQGVGILVACRVRGNVSGRNTGVVTLLFCQDHTSRKVGRIFRNYGHFRQRSGVYRNAERQYRNSTDKQRKHGRDTHRVSVHCRTCGICICVQGSAPSGTIGG